ncbi:MAG: Hsp20/alpha crystallin family protein [Candidatus Cloacimonadaceae bacterium]|jgi:HSP20 family molecular chaperone IbpA|nr:Hsp20/alpha crystallin family protein [Candidatus Cloacimonadota bacterium]MDX9949127.1 Hsp20/alpha crystallin family protein [Candidatus Syntrophosphaera sp.]NLN85683.1 Hsp20/alpha crystallin family protein [Candidatus Cloacimonadota bacterium]
MQEELLSNLNGIRREMLRILGEVSSLSHDSIAIEDAIDDVWHPKCDVYHTDTDWVVVVELAGVDKNAINISASTEFLRISGSRVLHKKNLQATYHSMEIDTGRFDRRIFFPDLNLDKENPKVELREGILRISFPILARVERIIPIK